MVIYSGIPGPTSARPVVCVEEVAKAAGAVIAADVVMAVVVTGQLLVLALSALVHICRATDPRVRMKTTANIYRARSMGHSLC